MDFFTWLFSTWSGLFVLFLAVVLILSLSYGTIEHLAERNNVSKTSVVKVLSVIFLGTLAAILIAPLLWLQETRRQWKKGIEAHHLNSLRKK